MICSWGWRSYAGGRGWKMLWLKLRQGSPGLYIYILRNQVSPEAGNQFFTFSFLQIAPRNLGMLNMHPTAQLHPQPCTAHSKLFGLCKHESGGQAAKSTSTEASTQQEQTLTHIDLPFCLFFCNRVQLSKVVQVNLNRGPPASAYQVWRLQSTGYSTMLGIIHSCSRRFSVSRQEADELEEAGLRQCEVRHTLLPICLHSNCRYSFPSPIPLFPFFFFLLLI